MCVYLLDLILIPDILLPVTICRLVFMSSISSLLWALFLSSCISLTVWKMSDICFPGIFFFFFFPWDILLTDILHCLLHILFLLQEGGYGSRKGTVGLWGLSRSAGSFPPISHLLMRAILPRTSIYNIQDMVSKIGSPKQLTAFIWVGGGGSTSTLSFCVNSCRARGQNGSTVKPLS